VPQAVEVSSPLLTIPEAAKFLHAPIYTVRLLIRRGKLRHQRIGKRFVVPRADVEAHLESGWKREGVR
jgi:excisionase family DNA binding protein